MMRVIALGVPGGLLSGFLGPRAVTAMVPAYDNAAAWFSTLTPFDFLPLGFLVLIVVFGLRARAIFLHYDR